MSEEKFDVIVVGAGLAGNVAAYQMAKAGLEVLVIERGEVIGSKNVTGGRLYSHSLEKIFPNFAEEAPVERVVKHEKISMMTADGSLDIGYNSSDVCFDGNTCAVLTALHGQSPDIAQGVNAALEGRSVGQNDIGAGDQGMMFG